MTQNGTKRTATATERLRAIDLSKKALEVIHNSSHVIYEVAFLKVLDGCIKTSLKFVKFHGGNGCP